MALTRVIPIKQVRMSVDDISGLLKELSSYHRKAKDRFIRNYYSLSIDQDENTSTTLDLPPRNFGTLLSPKINNIVLRIENREPVRKIQLHLTHGDSKSYSNKIEIYGHEEDWVNLTWQKLSDRIAALEQQPLLSEGVRKAAFITVAAISGWLIVTGFAHITQWSSSPIVNAGKPETLSWGPMLFSATILSISVGLWPAGWLFSYAKSAYPSVELQTGPTRDRIEPIRRQRLIWICSVFIGGPSANLLYDIYRSLF